MPLAHRIGLALLLHTHRKMSSSGASKVSCDVVDKEVGKKRGTDAVGEQVILIMFISQ